MPYQHETDDAIPGRSSAFEEVWSVAGYGLSASKSKYQEDFTCIVNPEEFHMFFQNDFFRDLWGEVAGDLQFCGVELRLGQAVSSVELSTEKLSISSK